MNNSALLTLPTAWKIWIYTSRERIHKERLLAAPLAAWEWLRANRPSAPRQPGRTTHFSAKAYQARRQGENGFRVD